MAFKKEKEFYGIQLPSAYYKINHLSTTEDGSDVDGKFYKVFAQLYCYTNEAKEHLIEQTTKEISGLREIEINFAEVYSRIMDLEEFAGAESV